MKTDISFGRIFKIQYYFWKNIPVYWRVLSGKLSLQVKDTVTFASYDKGYEMVPLQVFNPRLALKLHMFKLFSSIS